MIKTEDQIKMIRIAGKILANVAIKIKEAAKEGVSLKALDQLAKRLIEEAGAEPAFLGYQPYGAEKPFPASICASLNEVVVHGVPTDYKLKSGDLLKLDFGVAYQGFIADGAFTAGVGKISETASRLIGVTKHALQIGIKECKPNKTLGDIGWAINNYVTKHSFKVVKGLSGHGVGLELHEDPPVFNEGQKNTGLKLKPGMVLALEPMVSAGDPYLLQLPDDSYATRDKSLTAHFEHTVLITKGEPEILTR
ncbi:MAG: type I methionyl aminopeptidase [Candidatus Harrisonbacteria bacterium]|nr:type I methionyl aminopeptidase [Candidatus Harrisonbacteria bacterium]